MPVSLVGLGLAYSNFYGVYSIAEPFPSMFFAVGCAGLIVALIDLEIRLKVRMPRSVTLVRDASYSLYLWHWLMIPVVSTVAYSTGFVVPELWRWITVVASVAVAIVSFHWIEKPIEAIGNGVRWLRPNSRLGRYNRRHDPKLATTAITAMQTISPVSLGLIAAA